MTYFAIFSSVSIVIILCSAIIIHFKSKAKMEKFNIKERLQEIERMRKKSIIPSDLTDMGNIIGFKIAPYISKELGFELEDLISGIEHGVSLVDGTHDSFNEPIKATQANFTEFVDERFWELI